MMIRLTFIAALLLALSSPPALPELPELPELSEFPALPDLPPLPELPVLHAAQQTTAAPSGDAKRGQELYDKTYKCYACHGFDGQTGNPRLVPMKHTQDGFVAYVRKPATPAMPKFVDPPEKDLVDVYAYIRSIPVAAAPADSIPLLKGIIDRRAKGN